MVRPPTLLDQHASRALMATTRYGKEPFMFMVSATSMLILSTGQHVGADISGADHSCAVGSCRQHRQTRPGRRGLHPVVGPGDACRSVEESAGIATLRRAHHASTSSRITSMVLMGSWPPRALTDNTVTPASR